MKPTVALVAFLATLLQHVHAQEYKVACTNVEDNGIAENQCLPDGARFCVDLQTAGSQKYDLTCYKPWKTKRIFLHFLVPPNGGYYSCPDGNPYGVWACLGQRVTDIGKKGDKKKEISDGKHGGKKGPPEEEIETVEVEE